MGKVGGRGGMGTGGAGGRARLGMGDDVQGGGRSRGGVASVPERMAEGMAIRGRGLKEHSETVLSGMVVRPEIEAPPVSPSGLPPPESPTELMVP